MLENTKVFLALFVFWLIPLLASVDGFCSTEQSITLPVFPGAQGFGTDTPAGRGGKILKVSNLKASGKGSLKAAIETKGPRIIVFEVGGIIELESNLKIKDPFVTIAGQTAPSPGITLKGAGLVISSHDVLVQHLRIRTGDSLQGPSPEDREGLKIGGRGSNVYNVVCDHLSISWGVDEVVSTVYRPQKITISNSIISEGLQASIHPDGSHSKGMLIREGTKDLSLIGNLFAHNYDRNPRIAGDTSVVLINNVLYNTGRRHWIELDRGRAKKPHLASIVGNVFIPGPDTKAYALPIKVQNPRPHGTRVYHTDNRATGDLIVWNSSVDPQSSSPPIWHPSLKPHPANAMEALIIKNVGAWPADRDPVDERVIQEFLQRNGSVVNSVKQAGGWPNTPATRRPFHVRSDPAGDADGDGYTNIEEVLHRHAQEVEKGMCSSRRNEKLNGSR